VITLSVFAGFSVLYLREEFRWSYAVGFALILAAVAVVFGFGDKAAAEGPAVSAACDSLEASRAA
jgi:drug/metabolite transporter (DMT)-like permease